MTDISNVRQLAIVISLLWIAAPAAAQSGGAMRDGVAFGATVAPAHGSDGPSFAPGLRLSVPIPSRMHVDADSVVIFGQSAIRSYLGFQLRRLNQPRTVNRDGRYWLAGMRYFPKAPTGSADPKQRSQPDTQFTVGYGWDWLFENGARAGLEVGYGQGGRTYSIFMALVLQGRFGGSLR